MKKDELKKSLKLQLHRETLRALEQPELREVAAGVSGYACSSKDSRATCCTSFC